MQWFTKCSSLPYPKTPDYLSFYPNIQPTRGNGAVKKTLQTLFAFEMTITLHSKHGYIWRAKVRKISTDCGEEGMSAKHLWLRCPATMTERYLRQLGQSFSESTSLPIVSPALPKIFLTRSITTTMITLTATTHRAMCFLGLYTSWSITVDATTRSLYSLFIPSHVIE